MLQIFLIIKGITAIALNNINFKEPSILRIYQVIKERLNSKKNIILESWAAYTLTLAKL